MRTFRHGLRAVALTIGLALALGGGAEGATVAAKCQSAIIRGSERVVATRTKALQRCEAGVVAGVPGYASPPGGPCTDAGGKTAVAIAKAEDKFKRLLDQRCGGSDKRCGTGSDDAGPDVYDFATGPCRGFARKGCTYDVDHCGGVASDGRGVTDCLLCVDDTAVDTAMNLYADAFQSAEFGTGSVTNRCQAALETEPAKFLAATSKARAKCWQAITNGKPGFASPCPSGDSSNKTQTAIAKAETAMIENLCRACGGADGACDMPVANVPGSGNADDITPAAIGFLQQCPAAYAPVFCGNYDALDGMPDVVDSLRELILCVDCMTKFTVGCADGAAVPSLAPYDFECRECIEPPPTGACPTSVDVAVDTNGSNVDLGWTGSGHDVRIPTGSLLTLGVTSCQYASEPCAVCSVNGPVASGSSLEKRRCSDAPWVHCGDDADCAAASVAGPCTYFLGAPLPMSRGGIGVCMLNEVAGAVTGTLNVTAGQASMTVPVAWRPHTGGAPDAPCPLCVAGPCAGGRCCSAGPRAGQACSVDGEDPDLGSLSLDCPPDPGTATGVFRTRLPLATDDFQQLHMTAASPQCRAGGWESRKCFCDTCNNADADPCMSDADCPENPSGTPGICGGPRCLGGGNAGVPCAGPGDCDSGSCGVPGQPTAPNACADGFCFDLDEKSFCVNGAYEGRCSTETFRSCATNADCQPPSNGGTCPNCRVHQRCDLVGLACFPDNGVIGRHCFGASNNGEPCNLYADCPAQGVTNVECGGGTTVVSGKLSPSCAGHAEPTLGGTFCVPPSGSGALDAALGLPGLGRAKLAVRLTLGH